MSPNIKSMAERPTGILRHILDSILVVVFAGTASGILLRYISPRDAAILGLSKALPAFPIGIVSILSFPLCGILVASLAPRHFISAVSGIRYFPVHWGLVIRCWLGGCLTILVVLSLSPTPWALNDVHPLVVMIAYTAALSASVGFGWLVARALYDGKDRFQWGARDITRDQGALSAGDSAAVVGKTEGFHAWLTEDGPVCTEEENRIPAHQETARRILARLVMRAESGCDLSCNVAIIGGYGSGKTSISNLVRWDYQEQVKQHPYWPRLMFCRFEAWRYLDAAAALRGLMQVVAETVLEEADESALWSLGENYVRAVAEAGPSWARSAASLLGGEREPTVLLQHLGDLLLRLNRRVIVFVDDLDRLESSSDDQQHALVRALNQFQSVANVYYVLAVGPARWEAPSRQERRPLLDLIKLTRFQELVPCVDLDVMLTLIRHLRDHASDDLSMFFPWAVNDTNRHPQPWEDDDKPEDPLRVSMLMFAGMHVDYCGILEQLLQTPRALKATLRETHASWEGGLKGEINWYDLLLANALKTAEPGVFEWILRDKEFFLTETPLLGREDAEKKKRESEELQQRLRGILQVESDLRYEVVADALCRLFPVFAERINTNRPMANKADPAKQKLSSTPPNGQSYLYRFAAGCVPRGDLSDKPTLTYIKEVRERGFDRRVLEDTYLGSKENLLGPLNKLIQFAEHLESHTLLQIGEVIIYWTARPDSICIWPEPGRFYNAMCGDVCRILHHAHGPELEDWVQRTVGVIAGQSPLLAADFIRTLSAGSSVLAASAVQSSTITLWANTVTERFITGPEPLAPVVTQYRFALMHLLNFLKGHYGGYDQVKQRLTHKLIDEAEQNMNSLLQNEILFALASEVQYPVMNGPVPVEAYKITYSKNKHGEMFDMATLLPALSKWHTEGVADPLAQRVIRELGAEYGLGKDTLPL